MIIDIRKDVPDFLTYIKKRVAQHVAAAKKQKRAKRVSRIDFGFEFGQGNELWLVFDTRPNAEPDGQWTGQIESMKGLKRPRWPLWEDLPDGEELFFIDLKGKKVNVTRNPDEKICKIVGEAMRHALLTARDEGMFEPLAKAEKCELGVENMEGYYGWPKYEDRGKENLAEPSAKRGLGKR